MDFPTERVVYIGQYSYLYWIGPYLILAASVVLYVYIALQIIESFRGGDEIFHETKQLLYLHLLTSITCIGNLIEIWRNEASLVARMDRLLYNQKLICIGLIGFALKPAWYLTMIIYISGIAVIFVRISSSENTYIDAIDDILISSIHFILLIVKIIRLIKGKDKDWSFSFTNLVLTILGYSSIFSSAVLDGGWLVYGRNLLPDYMIFLNTIVHGIYSIKSKKIEQPNSASQNNEKQTNQATPSTCRTQSNVDANEVWIDLARDEA